MDNLNIYSFLKKIDNKKIEEEDNITNECLYYSNSIVNYGVDEEVCGLC